MDSFPARPTTPVDLRSPAGTIKVLRQGAAVTIDLDPKVLASTAFLKGDKGDPGRQGLQGQQGAPTKVNGKTGQTITLDAVDVGAWNDAAVAPQSKLIHGRQRRYNVSDYGCVEMASDAQSMAANVAALTAAMADINAAPYGGTLVLPASRLCVNRQIGGTFANGIEVVGAGYNSELYFNAFSVAPAGAVNGLLLLAGSNVGWVKAHNFRIIGRNSPTLTGVLMTLRGNGGMGGVAASDLVIDCDSSILPAVYLRVINPTQCTLRSITVEGGQGSWGTSGTGIDIRSDTTATDCALHGVIANRVGTGYQFTGGDLPSPSFEGASLTDCISFGVQTGLNLVGGNYRVPGYSWKGGHINARLTCLRADKWAHFRVADAQWQLDQGAGTAQAIAYITNCTNFRFHHNHFGSYGSPPSGSTAIPAGIAIAGSGIVMVENNFFDAVPGAPIFNQDGSTTVRYRDNEKNGTVAWTQGTVTDLSGNISI